jgi:type I restriction enzyme R subunit
LPLEGPSSTGTGLVREERVRLSKLIDVVNDRFGTDFTEADQLFFDQIVEDATSDTSLAVAANANPVDKFAVLFGGHVESLMIDRMGQNEEIFGKYMGDPTFQSVVNGWLAAEVYRKLQKPPTTGEPTAEYDAAPSE